MVRRVVPTGLVALVLLALVPCACATRKRFVLREVANVSILYPTGGLEPERLTRASIQPIMNRAGSIVADQEVWFVVVPENHYRTTVDSVVIVFEPDIVETRYRKGRYIYLELGMGEAAKTPVVNSYLQLSTPDGSYGCNPDRPNYAAISFAPPASLSPSDIPGLVDAAWVRLRSVKLRPSAPITVEGTDDGLVSVNFGGGPRRSVLFSCDGAACALTGDIRSNYAY